MALEELVEEFHKYVMKETEDCFRKQNEAIQRLYDYFDSAFENKKAKNRWLPARTPKKKSTRNSRRKSTNLHGKSSTSVSRLSNDNSNSGEASSTALRRTRRGTALLGESSTTQKNVLPKRSTRQRELSPPIVEDTARRSKRATGARSKLFKTRKITISDQDSSEDQNEVQRAAVSKKRASLLWSTASSDGRESQESPIELSVAISAVKPKRIKPMLPRASEAAGNSCENQASSLQPANSNQPIAVIKKIRKSQTSNTKRPENEESPMSLRLDSSDEHIDENIVKQDKNYESADRTSTRSNSRALENMPEVSVNLHQLKPEEITRACSEVSTKRSTDSVSTSQDNLIFQNDNSANGMKGKSSGLVASLNNNSQDLNHTCNSVNLGHNSRGTFVNSKKSVSNLEKDSAKATCSSFVVQPQIPESVVTAMNESEIQTHKTVTVPRISIADTDATKSNINAKKRPSEEMDDSVIILDTEDEESPLKRPLRATRATLKKVKIEQASPVPLDKSAEIQVDNRVPSKALQSIKPLRINSLQDPKRSLRSHLIPTAKTPESPKQLFSAYTNSSIKTRTDAFENILKDKTPKTPIGSPIKSKREALATSSRKPRKSSFERQMINYSKQTLVKAIRRSTTGRRSTLSRFKARSNMNAKIALDQENSRVENKTQIIEVSDSDNHAEQDSSEDTNSEKQNMAERRTSSRGGSGQPEPANSVRRTSPRLSRRAESVNSAELPTVSTPESDSEWMDESPQKIITPAAKENPKKQNVPVETIPKPPRSFALSGFKKTSIEKSFHDWSAKRSTGLKTTTNKPVPKSNYPGSETRHFSKSRVAALAQLYDKAPENKGGSCGRIQGTSRVPGNASLMTNSVKNFQRPAYATKTRAALMLEELEKKKAKEEEALRKRQEIMKQRMEDAKRKNEVNLQRVKENRIRNDSENQRKTLELQEHANAQVKRNQEQMKAKMEARRQQRLKREMEIEERRKQDEAARLAKLKEEQLETQRLHELAELKKQQQKLAAVAIASTALSKAHPKPVPQSNLNSTFNVNMNQTFTADQSVDASNYDMTPHRSELPKEELIDKNNYNIEDLNSEDDTDEETNPKKKIPEWAQGVKLRLAVVNQARNPIDIDTIFNPVFSCDLSEFFTVQRSRFKVRTSSAVWHHAIRE